MNTGFLSTAVATALTVYGIETANHTVVATVIVALQQHLPFTVLKLSTIFFIHMTDWSVATALTVYGIETTAYFNLKGATWRCNSTYRLRY